MVSPLKTGSETLIFWGAGATASFGMPVTIAQAKAIRELVGSDSGEKGKSLKERVRSSGISGHERWNSLLIDLLTVLGDDLSSEKKIGFISDDGRDAMGRHCDERCDEMVVHLRTLFDWAALKEACRVCPGMDDADGFSLQDLFNVLDLHIASGQGFPVLEGTHLDHTRVIGAKRALQMILSTFFFIRWQEAIVDKKNTVEKYLEFGRILGRYHQKTAVSRAASGKKFKSRDFYLGEVAFASLNYDPLCLWIQFVANQQINNSYPPHIGFPAMPVKVFHDMGVFMGTKPIDDTSDDIWFPMNEAAAQRLNDQDYDSRRVILNKLLFPHGCFCWRECPSCGKLSSYLGDSWNIASPSLIPPPPLRGFAKEAGINGFEADERPCVHCGIATFAQHTQTVMQSNFKPRPASFLDEVKRDLRVATNSANHIVLMGYTLPPDDVDYRVFFASRINRENGKEKPTCSVVVGHSYGDRWMESPEEIDKAMDEMKADGKENEAPYTTLKAARSIFGKENVRFYGGGIPNVFCEGDSPSEERVRKLICYKREV